jgi:hypothetical protein
MTIIDVSVRNIDTQNAQGFPPPLALEMQSDCALIEAALAMGLLNSDRMSPDKIDIWRANFDAETFEAAMRARERFAGIAAALGRRSPPNGSCERVREIALWEGALTPQRASKDARLPTGYAVDAPAGDGPPPLDSAAAHDCQHSTNMIDERTRSAAFDHSVWRKFPQYLLGKRFRGLPQLSAAARTYERSKPEAKARLKKDVQKYRARPEIRRKRAERPGITASTSTQKF